MSTKRKKAPVKKAPAKRGKRKEESDVDSELSDNSENEHTTQPDEVLIAGHGDVLDEPTQLPQELLKTLIKPAGQLMIFGSVNWDNTISKVKDSKQKMHPNLYEPHLFTDLKVRLAVSGCVSTHSILITEDGKAMTFGRNKFGQLGLEHIETTDVPAIVPGLANVNVIGAACGRNHSLFLTDTGTVYACGDNRSGQCGIGNLQQTILSPTRINYRGAPIIKVGCGADFSIILDIKGGLHSFGLPEHGQLGHNTDGKYFKTNTRLCFNFETSPKRIVLYIEKSKDGHVAPVDITQVVDFSCGQSHTVAIDSKKRAFSWGFGGFGRLGHAETKDELVPRLIKYFDAQSRGIRSVSCGSTYSLAVTDFGGLYMFGQTKRSGEANMYPKPVQDLAGWSIKTVAAGNTSIIVSADESVISWGGTPTFGELGLGEWSKSSTTPKEIRLVVSGCSACHSVVVTEEGKAMTFGRNKFGQLGLNHTDTVDVPTEVPALANMNVIGAAIGRHHTIFLTDTGTVYACGDNRSGQCGVGSSQPTVVTPTRINYRGAPIVKVGCGAEFSVILDVKGGLHSFGLPEYGQLGHNTDGKYFKTSTKLSYNCETSPKRIVLYIEKSKDGHVAPVDVTEIVDFNCGNNHTVAIDSKKRAFSWGFGGFGRLGHAETKDELVPRLIKYFEAQSRGIRSICCGSTFSLFVADFGGLYMCGQNKRTGEANMYPKPIQDLAGWNINSVAAANTSIIVSADESVIAWGCSPTFGELGLGEWAKSSANPKEVTKLQGHKVLGLTMGYGHTLLISENNTPEQKTKLESFETFEF